MLRSALALSPTWLRASSWRRDDSQVETMFGPEHYATVALAAERAGFDALFRPDAMTLDPERLADSPGFANIDPLVLLAYLAAVTERIGLFTTASTTFAPPFLVARQLQSLDRVSGGRAGLNAVTSLGGAENFGDQPMASSEDRLARASEWLDVVAALWASFPDEALVMDRAAGRFADPHLVRPVDFAGEQIAVKGPIDVPAVSRGRIPVMMAGGGPAWTDQAGRHADAVFVACPTDEVAAATRLALRDAASRHGRADDAVATMPGLSLHLADSRAEAEALAAASRTEGDPRHPLGGPLHWTVIGTVDDAADEIERRAGAGIVDGFVALPGGWRGSIDLVTEELMPELARRGLVRGGGDSSTLAERWALVPPS
ncbi:LLM class flavin-dependent oxidoreductase [Demequina sp. NBRC 110054]|uniref:LLM class flavin-dependent oxidoreductase n=1 Tax=Demequina sp. NBRC 110054 TaxID=1570343 RepID=UPI000A03B158|nr:LLM class flavin-dependent oxidoreductase [Demequina sp. NBRC 110054]